MTRSDPPSDRIGVLDVLRGIALLGMFLVHFNDNSSAGTGLAGLYPKIVQLFFEERFWTMFGILFGAGFAIQFLRAEARGDPYTAKYLRRMVGLAFFGFIAHAVFGFNVLLGYAIWGVPLLLFRKLSTRALIVALVLSATSGAVYQIARATYGVATEGEPAYRAEQDSIAAKNKAFLEANEKARNATSYPAVFAARLQHMRWFYVQWFTFLPVNTLTLFLIGLLGMRLGIFDRPEEHRRLIISLAIFGALSWAFSLWMSSTADSGIGTPYVTSLVRARLRDGFGLIRGTWLAFTYIGTVLLLVARDRAWLNRLSAFGWTGRMALTNYMIQIAILDLAFSAYALGLHVTPLVGLVAALALFLIDAEFSKWWLTRFRFGPLEWVWRSITYARWEPLRMKTLVFCIAFLTLGAAAQAQRTVIHADRVLDGRGGTLHNITIVVEGSRIARIETAQPGRFPADYELGTLTLLPGMIDAHSHLAWYFNRKGRLHTSDDGDTPAESILAAAGNAYATLLAGFTTVQSPGSPEDKDLRDWIASGAIPGPRVLTSLEPLSDAKLSPDSLRLLVRERKKQGADLIKVFASKSIREGGAATMSAEQLDAICGEARAQGLRTLVHAHSTESMERAIHAGCTQIEHGVFATDSVLAEMASKKVYFDPQCGLVFHNYLDNRAKYDGIGNYNAEGFAAMERAIPLAQDVFRRAMKTRYLKVVFGTDAVAGAHGRNAEELVCRVTNGQQTPMKAIISATSLAAEALGMQTTIGTIAPGYEADIIGVDGDASTDITALQRVRFVMKGGKVYSVLPRR